MPKDISSGNISIVFSNSSVIFNDYFYESDYIGNIKMGYENTTNGTFSLTHIFKSLAERALVNDFYDAHDVPQLSEYPCKRIVTGIKQETRCRVGEVNFICSFKL